MKKLILPVVLTGFLLCTAGAQAPGFGSRAEKGDEKVVAAQKFDGKFLGLEIHADRLGVVLDVSESMARSLPTDVACRNRIRVRGSRRGWRRKR